MLRPISKEEFIQAADSGDLNNINRYFVQNENNFFEINATNQNGDTALLCAAQNGHTEVVRRLLTMPDIAINATRNGWTALMLAAEEGHIEVVRLLLARPDIAINTTSTTNHYGWTALMLAAEEGHTEVVRLLLARADIAINTSNEDGDTALMLAADERHTEVARLLLARPDIAINTTNKYGATALLLAATKGCLVVVHLLLEAGADTTLKNKEGKTAGMLSATDEIRNLILDTTLENKLAAFEIKRARLTKPPIRTPEDLQIKSQLEIKATREGVGAVLTADEERVKAQLEREKIAVQEAADLTFKAALADLDFLLAHRDNIKDFSSLPNLVMRFSEFIGTLADDKELDAYSRQLRRVAATMGHGLAQHIETNFNDAKTEEDRDKAPAPREGSSLGFFSTPPLTVNCCDREEVQNRRDNP